MKAKVAIVLILSMFSISLVMATAQDKSAPETIVFETRNGNVTFQHKAHMGREENKCETCHDAVFPKNTKAPLNYKPRLHKEAEANKTSCATCHVAEGKAFESKGNCSRCHEKKAPPPS